MDSLETYVQLVKQLLNDYAKIPISNQADIYNEVIFDTEHNRYLLVSLGWSNSKRVHHTVIHIDIIDGQVWIQANNTDQLIAEELVESGIPAQSIVLGLQPPEVLPYTAYGLPHNTQQSECLTT